MMPDKRSSHIIPIHGISLINIGDDIAEIILSTLEKQALEIREGDIVVITHSIVSVAEGKVYEIQEVRPSEKAKQIAENTGQLPERVEIALKESVQVLREDPVLITITKQGLVTDYSGVDESNAPSGTIVALPDEPDESARRISNKLSKKTGFNVPVIITDTQGRPWRQGAINLAIGIAGMSPFTENMGKPDIYGSELRGSLVCLADQIASASELAMGQADEGVPIAIARGFAYMEEDGSASSIIRSSSENLFL